MTRWKARWAWLGVGMAVAGMAGAQERGTNAADHAFQELLRQASERDRLGRETNGPGAEVLGFETQLSFEQMEALFLNGSISARQFQFYINNRRSAEPATEEQKQAIHDQAIAVLRETKPDPAKNPKPGPAVKPEQLPLLSQTPEPQPAPQAPQADPWLEGFEEIEAKMEELLRLKEARDRATNAAPETPTAQASHKPKRERLNDLLRLYIDGKIGQAEYNERRAQVIAEPESP